MPIALLLFAAFSTAPQLVSFPSTDQGLVFANIYGTGERAVVLAHGGRFNKESWGTQARLIAAEGFRVLALDFRGYGQSKGPGDADPLGAPLHFDVLAAVRYLRQHGATSVSLVGGSMGGWASAEASVVAKSGEIDALILIGSGGGSDASKIKGRKLFILSRDDIGPGDRPRLPGIQADYDKAAQPKEMIVLPGSAHAQYMFATEQGGRLMREIVRFLKPS